MSASRSRQGIFNPYPALKISRILIPPRCYSPTRIPAAKPMPVLDPLFCDVQPIVAAAQLVPVAQVLEHPVTSTNQQTVNRMTSVASIQKKIYNDFF